MDYSGAQGTLIHEKNWDRKSRVRLLLKYIVLIPVYKYRGIWKFTLLRKLSLIL